MRGQLSRNYFFPFFQFPGWAVLCRIYVCSFLLSLHLVYSFGRMLMVKCVSSLFSIITFQFGICVVCCFCLPCKFLLAASAKEVEKELHKIQLLRLAFISFFSAPCPSPAWWKRTYHTLDKLGSEKMSLFTRPVIE